MIIKKVDVYKCEVEANMNYWFCERKIDDVYIVAIHTTDACGWGECIDFSHNSFNHLLENSHKLLGKDALLFRSIIPDELNSTPSFRECIEIALYDLIGRSAGVPVHTLLGGKRNNQVPGMPVIHLGTAEEMAKKAGKWDYGFFKVKVSCDPDRDLEIIESIRKENKECTLYADFNCGYSDLDQCIDIINEMEKLGVSVIEDPISKNQGLQVYKKIREKTNVKIMIDEYARTLSNMLEIANGDYADIINIHTSVQGGLFSAMEKSIIAGAADIDYMVGSDGFLGITDAAYQNLASVILKPGFPCEEVGGSIYHECCIVKNPYPQKDGMIFIPNRPGLGVEIDKKQLDTITVEKITIK